MSVRIAAEELVARAAAVGKKGRVLTDDEARSLMEDISVYPQWLAELLKTVPLCGLEIGWQASEPEPKYSGVEWIVWSDASNVISETVECYPGLAILPAGYINIASECIPSGNPYFICIHDCENPPIYQIYHEFGDEAEVLLKDGRNTVSVSLSEFFRSAVV